MRGWFRDRHSNAACPEGDTCLSPFASVLATDMAPCASFCDSLSALAPVLRSCTLKKMSLPSPPLTQVVAASATDKFLTARRADQQRALTHLREDPGLAGLQVIIGPLFDLEVRGLQWRAQQGNMYVIRGLREKWRYDCAGVTVPHSPCAPLKTCHLMSQCTTICLAHTCTGEGITSSHIFWQRRVEMSEMEGCEGPVPSKTCDFFARTRCCCSNYF